VVGSAASPAGQVKDAPEPTTSASQAWWWRDGSSGQ